MKKTVSSLLLLAGVLFLLFGLNTTILALREYPGTRPDSDISFDDVNPLWGPYGETLAFERIYKSRPVEYQIYIFEPFGERYVTKLVPTEMDDSSYNSFFRWIDIRKEVNSRPYNHTYEYVYVKNSELYVGQTILKKIFDRERGTLIPGDDPDINEKVFVSTGTMENGYPDCSSEKKMIAYASGLTGVTDIYIKQYEMSSSDTGPGEGLITGDFQDTMPRWSPDGKDLAYASQVAGDKDAKSNMEIFVIKNALSKDRKFMQLTKTELDETVPTWSPDGKMIAYYSLRITTDKEDKEENESGGSTGPSEGKVFDLCVVDVESKTEIARAEFVYRQEHRGPVWVSMPDELGNIKDWIFFISGDYSVIKALELDKGKPRVMDIEGLEGYNYKNITDLDCIYIDGGTEKGVRIAYSALSENHQKRIYCAICETMNEGFLIKKEN